MSAYTVWKIEGNRRAVEVTTPDSRPNAECAAATLNAHASEGVRYEAIMLGGSPFDGAMITYQRRDLNSRFDPVSHTPVADDDPLCGLIRAFDAERRRIDAD